MVRIYGLDIEVLIYRGNPLVASGLYTSINPIEPGEENSIL